MDFWTAEKTAVMVTITPEIAAALLERNTENRNLSERVVDSYARDLRAGNWVCNGDAIRLRADGVLADGQHRLKACVKTGISFQTIVVTGLSREDMLTVDRGRIRLNGDMLGLVHGVPDGKSIAATINALVVFATGEYPSRLTGLEMDRIYRRIPEITPSLHVCGLNKQAAMSTRNAVFFAIHYIGATIQNRRSDADRFTEVLQTGVPSYEDDAAHRLRDLLLRNKTSAKRFRHDAHYAYTLSAWQKFSARQGVKTLRPVASYRIADVGAFLRLANNR